LAIEKIKGMEVLYHFSSYVKQNPFTHTFFWRKIYA